MSRAGIVIVTFNSEQVVDSCLEACERAGAVTVVDNASTDGTVAAVSRHSTVRLLANEQNRGFAGAVNQAFEQTREDLILILNPDVVLDRGIEQLQAAFTDSRVGAAGGQLVGSDSQPQHGFMVRRLPTPASLCLEVLGINRLWPGNPVNRRYRCRDFDSCQASDVEQPAGAFLMIRRETWMAVGGFDEGFHPVWFEDVDFCRRLLAAGWKIRYIPSARGWHKGGDSVRRLEWDHRQVYWYGSLLRYASKHFRPWPRRAVCASVMLASVPRLVWGLFQERNHRSVGVFVRIVSLAVSHFLRGEAIAAGGPASRSESRKPAATT